MADIFGPAIGSADGYGSVNVTSIEGQPGVAEPNARDIVIPRNNDRRYSVDATWNNAITEITARTPDDLTGGLKLFHGPLRDIVADPVLNRVMNFWQPLMLDETVKQGIEMWMDSPGARADLYR